MTQSSTHTYRVLKSSWGIWITVTAEVLLVEGAVVEALPVGHGIWLAQNADRTFSEAEMGMLNCGLQLLAQEIEKAVVHESILISVNELRYVETDFQLEGIAAAIFGWAITQFGLSPRDIDVSFNKKANRYDFSWPHLDSP